MNFTVMSGWQALFTLFFFLIAGFGWVVGCWLGSIITARLPPGPPKA